MNTLAAFDDGKFHIEPAMKPSGVVAVFHGEMSSRDPSATLTPFFDQFLTQLEKTHLTLDFRRVSFMNSSSLGPIIVLVRQLNERGVDTTLVYDGSRSWQKISMQCMSVMCQKMSHIKVTLG